MLLSLSLGLLPRPSAAQFSEPCQVACALVLGLTGITVATGSVVAVARQNGGFSTQSGALRVWWSGFGLAVGAGVALSVNGERQARAVYAAGIGAVAGSLVGLSIESLRAESDGARKLSATLIGAAAGAVVAGVYGALSHSPSPGTGAQSSQLIPLFTVSVPH